MTDHFSFALRSLHACEVEITDDDLDVDIVMSLHELYTAKACDELAVALAELIEGGEVVQVRADGEWPGGFLLHAGVRRDDVVYDIEGVHEVDEWIDRWGRGMDVEVRFLDPAADQQTHQNGRSRQIAVETALRLLEVPELDGARKSSLQL